MTATYNPIGQCWGKRTYQTRAQARKARSGLPRRTNGRTLCVYLCPHCDRYHIGHAVPSEAQQ